MKKIARTLLILLTAYVSIAAIPVADQQVKDYLGLRSAMLFDGDTYPLSWSSHPSDNFYKQEYAAKGDNVERYNKMILVDVLTGNQAIKSIVDMKVAELAAQKLTNPHVDYTVMQQSGESVLDFIITANAADGKTISIAERNIYRYKKFVTASGKTGILLFGISTRSYGAGSSAFIKTVNAGRKTLRDKFLKLKMPAITISQ